MVRISYDHRNQSVENVVFDLFRPGECPNRLVPKLRVPEGLGTLLDHEVSFHHHQNTKAGNVLTNSQLWAGQIMPFGLLRFVHPKGDR